MFGRESRVCMVLQRLEAPDMCSLRGETNAIAITLSALQVVACILTLTRLGHENVIVVLKARSTCSQPGETSSLVKNHVRY